MTSRTIFAYLFCACTLGALTSLADTTANSITKDPLVIEVPKQTTLFKQGEPQTVKLLFTLPKGYHGYADSLKVDPQSKDVEVGTFKLTPTVEFFDKFTKTKRLGFTTHTEFELPLTFKTFPQDMHGSLSLKVTYQACTDQFCLLPSHQKIEVLYGMAGDNSSWFDKVKHRGILLQLLIVFFAGVLTSLTPCIFPMIPITLSILGTRGVGKTRKQNFLISLVYVLGIATTYSVFGFAAAKTGTLFGSFLGKPWVVLVMAIIFFAMAISMFGVFEIQIPLSVQNRLQRLRFSQGFAGAFFYGLIAGVVASPCVGPVLVSVLTHVARLSDPVLGILYLFIYALGMGMLFLVLGTISHSINKLPKAGPWMEIVKFIFGVSLIGVALYYVHNVFSDRVFGGFVAISLVLVSGLYGALAPIHEVRGWRKIRKWVMAAFFCLGCGLGFKALFTDWNETKKESVSAAGWLPFNESKLEESLAKGQPVIIDFSAEWCGACKELDKFTFSDPEVQLKLKNFTLLKVDATTEDDRVSKLLTKFNVVGLPTIIFYDSSGKLVPTLTLTGFEPAAEFTKRLESVR